MQQTPVNIGILAHVDAGKTTLAESILFFAGAIQKPGRVDHQDAYLDTHELERRRGITIFSKMAQLRLEDREVTLLDTPGHVDFSAEMERCLGVMDYAILVISGADGVQGHDHTLWRLLRLYQIPTVIFINKMDQPGTDRDALMQELQEKLDGQCVDFTDAGEYLGFLPKEAGAERRACNKEKSKDKFLEAVCLSDERLLDAYLEGILPNEMQIGSLIRERRVFPCWFGSALKLTGVKEFLRDLFRLLPSVQYPQERFGARVYKITRDSAGERLTWMKITGGRLRVKDLLLSGRTQKEEEKADQIRRYSGERYTLMQEAGPGSIVAVTGLKQTLAGDTLGSEPAGETPVLEPVMRYRLVFPADVDPAAAYPKVKQLEEEIPELHVVWEAKDSSVQVMVMGEVQIEVLRQILLERFRLDAKFDAGSIVYKETIRNAVEGIGHYEPLRHYAEVHLILEPGERGSGLQFFSDVSTDDLALNWQRLILTHLEEKTHTGVLTGSEITDLKITIAAGRAHEKHTEGGDFRQATYRALRQGLMQAENVLLEPVYAFSMELPQDMLGRAMTDIGRMNGRFDDPVISRGMAVLTGTAPAKGMQHYGQDLAAYTKGLGHLECELKGYEECPDADDVAEEIGYRPLEDPENPCGSVFCAHGAGFVVPWDEVEDYMHLPRTLREKDGAGQKPLRSDTSAGMVQPGNQQTGRYLDGRGTSPFERHADVWDDEELLRIFENTFGKIQQKRTGWTKTKRSFSAPKAASRKPEPPKEEYLLVDGYNMIFAWEELRELAKVNLESARGKLADLLCGYQGYRGMKVILVFDAYKVEGGTERVFTYHNIHIVYTKEAETADAYIEKTTHEMSGRYAVTVATSDAAEQVIIFAQGARRMSARELKEEIEAAAQEVRDTYLTRQAGGKHLLFDEVDERTGAQLEDIRLHRK